MSEDLTGVFVALTVPVVIARLIVMFGYEQRSSKIWTAGLPTLAVLVFATRSLIIRQTDVLTITDWSAATSWGLILVTQLVATVYAWAPVRLWQDRHKEDGYGSG